MAQKQEAACLYRLLASVTYWLQSVYDSQVRKHINSRTAVRCLGAAAATAGRRRVVMQQCRAGAAAMIQCREMQ
jgi:hypothetical protein